MRGLSFVARRVSASVCLIGSFLLCLNIADAGQVSFSETDFPKEREVVRRLLRDEIQNAESLPSAGKVAVKIAVADLNMDGRIDIIAYIEHQRTFCGVMGCRVMVFVAGEKGDWITGLGGVIAGEEDIQVLDTKTNGYQDLLVGGKLKLVWDGHRYMTK